MMPPGIPMALIEDAIRRIPATRCLNPDQTRRELAALGTSAANRGNELASSEGVLMVLANVSDERYLSDFLDAADRLFSSDLPLRRNWIPSAIQFVRNMRDRFGVAPNAPPMPGAMYTCLNPFRIISALIEIERHLQAMDAIFTQMEPAYLADRQRIQAVRGPTILSKPANDPGRGSRMLSGAEQVVFATVRALRQEIATTLGLVQDGLRQLFPVGLSM